MPLSLVLAASSTLGGAACSSAPSAVPTDSVTDGTVPTTGAASATLPPANGGLDYQLGGAYPPAADVRVVSRDRTSPPAAGLYNICYVNGFQTQPGERSWWETNHPTLVLRDASGRPVIDPDWPDEDILDISTADKRSQIAAIVNGWIDGCATAGFQAIEVDNLDTYTRFSVFKDSDAVAVVRALADHAHARGLAIGQKNTSELLSRRADTALDFAIVEECSKTKGECQQFIAAYGTQVYIIEYDRAGFQADCKAFPQVSIVLRDREVSPPTSSSYVRDAC